MVHGIRRILSGLHSVLVAESNLNTKNTNISAYAELCYAALPMCDLAIRNWNTQY